MDNPAQLREYVQRAIVDIITNKLESGAMNDERAKQIAKYVLEMLPDDISYQKLMAVIPKLDDEFTELSAAIVPIMADYEKKVKKAVDEQIHKLVVAGKLDDALALTKKAIAYDKNLT